MTSDLFPSFPDTARVWIFPVVSSLSAGAEESLRRKLEEFISSWKAHGSMVHGAFRIVYGKFIIFVADSAVTLVSGCSIDSLYRAVASALEAAQVPCLESSMVVYRDGEAIRDVSREKFKDLVTSGKVSVDTIVFDNTITTLKALRAGQWELPCGRSWHAKAFCLETLRA